jgi:hypothetical protein
LIIRLLRRWRGRGQDAHEKDLDVFSGLSVENAERRIKIVSVLKSSRPQCS